MPRMRFNRWRKKDHEHNLLVAVSKWVRSRGGELIVVGGIEIQDWAEGMGKFKVAIRCMGRQPQKKEGEN